MANVRFGGGVADVRGSIGGSTFSRGRGGAIARVRVKGTQRHTAAQQARRSSLSNLAGQWNNILTAAQRAAWEQYAVATTWTNRLGDTITVTGMAAFVQTNALRLMAAQTILAAAPAAPGRVGAAPITATIVATTKVLSITAIGGSWIATTVGDTVHLFASAPMNPGRTGAPRGIHWVGSVIGASSTPLPFTVTLAANMVVGQNVVVESVHVDTTGRVAARERIIVVPS